MTNEEKAKEIAEEQQQRGFEKKDIYPCSFTAAMEMAEWKDQKAIEYLYKNIQSLLKDYDVSKASADIATQLFLANFKKAMEE